MYFPITVRTVTSGPGLLLWQVSDPMEKPEVKVNGIPVDVHPLIGNIWYPEYLDYTWDELREAVTTVVEAGAATSTLPPVPSTRDFTTEVSGTTAPAGLPRSGYTCGLILDTSSIPDHQPFLQILLIK